MSGWWNLRGELHGRKLPWGGIERLLPCGTGQLAAGAGNRSGDRLRLILVEHWAAGNGRIGGQTSGQLLHAASFRLMVEAGAVGIGWRSAGGGGQRPRTRSGTCGGGTRSGSGGSVIGALRGDLLGRLGLLGGQHQIAIAV